MNYANQISKFFYLGINQLGLQLPYMCSCARISCSGDLIDQIQNIFFLHTRQRFMIMGVEGFVKTRIKSKHFYTILKILCTYFKIDMTVRLSIYLQVKKVGKFTGFSGHFFQKKYWTIFLISFKAYRILLFSNSIQIQPPKSLYGILSIKYSLNFHGAAI